MLFAQLAFIVTMLTSVYNDCPTHGALDVGHVIIVFVVSHLVFDWFIESTYDCASPKVEIAN